jgi:catechol 2,3-dioxygenase-like lactoylglutathione lyase family enzyme
MIAGVRHTGIVVQDLEGAIKFWTELIGLKIAISQVEEGPFIENLIDLPGVKVHTVKLVCEDNSMIELLHFMHHTDKEQWGGKVYTTGITHIALNTKSIFELSRMLENHGYKILNPIRISNDGAVYACYMETFEGLLLELVQVA